MRYFALLNFQHVVLYLVPTVIFIILLGLALGCTHLAGRDGERRGQEVHRRYPDGLAERNAPFPLALALVIAGAVAWSFFYTLLIGVLGVKI
jgi:hypothetical protein